LRNNTLNTDNKIEDYLNELYKYYKQYLLVSDLDYLKKSLNQKESVVNVIEPFSFKEKFSGFLEYKSQMKKCLEIILTKICMISDHTEMQEHAEYYFKMEGKAIRPHFLIQLSKYIYECLNNDKQDFFESEVFSNSILPFSACIEALHNASLLQDDIIDDSKSRRNEVSAHNVFGIRNTVFSSNYILSKAASLITDINVDELNKVYSKIVFDLTYGEYEQSIKRPFIYDDNIEDIDKNFQKYMIKTYNKTASLIALSFKGVAAIFKLDEKNTKYLYNLGLHLGIVFQIVDDIIDVEMSSQILKKPSFKDIQEGIINGHLIYEMNGPNKDKVLTLMKRKFSFSTDIEEIKSLLNIGSGVIKSKNLAMDHLIESLNILNNKFFIDNTTKSKLIKSIIFMFNRNF
jgi:geranylgeranyl pyrophosphate synthase